MNKSNVIVDESILPHLNEIAERLWSTPSHAAIMVGAGFSKNANYDFPAWSTLGDIFFEKIHGRKPNKDKGEDRYLNALKLADEVQAAFGRPALDQLLRSNIPDTDSRPSPLHIKLLELPWSDVFTTNYDTLLDRARDSISSQKFDLVINKEDLVYSEKPRIIKLHGSFPSERPFIITEEDYRTYPRDFAPFVNTVQQSLLENTLCLIGFSGDDPNFLQWIGWIRDNLGKENSPKIYLIGIFSLSDAQKKLLEQRNIVLIDFSSSPDIGKSHYNAIERFFDYLFSRKKEENRLGWPENSKKLYPDSKQDKLLQLRELLEEWKTVRLNFPGWVVVPEENRNSLWQSTERWISYISVNDVLPETLDLYFSFELNWRLERCLVPIYNNLAELFETVLNKYWPFQDITSVGSEIKVADKENNLLSWQEIRSTWIYLSLSMLRFYREEGMSDKWEQTNRRLDILEDVFSLEQKNSLYFERVLFALFNLDIPKVKSELGKWPVNFSLPFWEAKRAGILAEIGEGEEAAQILERSLLEVRNKLNLKPVTINYTLVSQEASIMLLTHYIKQSNAIQNGQWDKQEEIRRQFTERWNTLKQYKCDLWNEIKLFEKKLEQPYIEKSPVTEKLGFDIGQTVKTHHLGSSNQDVLEAYRFVRFREELGLPYRLAGLSFGKESTEGAIQRLSKYSPNWAHIILMRLGDEKVIDQMFDRQSLFKLKISNIDNLIVEYLQILNKVESDIAQGRGLYVDNFGVLLAKTVPEILSRLCCKSTNDKKILLLEFLQKIYSSKHKHHYKGIGNLMKRLLLTYSSKEQYYLLPKLIDIPYPENTNILLEEEFQNPLLYLRITDEVINSYQKLELDKKQITYFFDLASSQEDLKRKWGISTLCKLYEFDLLSGDQSVELGSVLWSKTDEDAFPSNTQFHKFAFLDLPHPDTVYPSALIKKYISETDFPVHASQKDQGLPMTQGYIPLVTEILGASQYIDWSKEEIDDLLDKLIDWWNKDKQFLKTQDNNNPFGSIKDEHKSRFYTLIEVLIVVVLPRFEKETIKDKQRASLKQLIKEFDEYGLETIKLKATSIHLLDFDENILVGEIENTLRSNIEWQVNEGLHAILELIKHSHNISRAHLENLLITTSQKIYWTHEVGLASSISLIQRVVKDFPHFFEENIQSKVLECLTVLLDSTRLDHNLSKKDFFMRLKHREKAVGLVEELFHFYTKQKKTIPKEVLTWKEVCSNEEEFAEIKVHCVSM